MAAAPALAGRRLTLAALTALPLAALGGCDQVRQHASGGSRIDVQWHRSALLEGHLARWLEAAPTPNGFFRTQFDRRWNPRPQQHGALTGQCRLVYALAMGYELTQDRRYLEAARGGANFLLERMQDPVHGGFFFRVSPEGKPLAEHKNSYGHAFAIFALAHLHRVAPDERWRQAALSTWQTVERGMREPGGGLRADAPRDFLGVATGNRTQNPLMHLFEAMLALVDATQDEAARAGAAGLGRFAVYQLMQGQTDGSACIPEWYDGQWKPLTSKAEGAYVDLGHQFEWSHLLRGAEQRGLSAIYPQAGERILAYALKNGYDEIDGGAFNRLFPDGAVDRGKGWWQQAEALHALQAAARTTDKTDLWRRYEQTLALVREQFMDAERGGWTLAPRKQCQQGGCPDEQPDPYHMTAMHMAAIRSAPAPRR
jgi:cellobiose epimerase